MSIPRRLTGKPYNITMTNSVCLEHLFNICIVRRNWKRRPPKTSNIFSTTLGKQVSQSFAVFTWEILRTWKLCCSSIFFKLLISLTVNSLENVLEKRARKLKKSVTLIDTKITFGTTTVLSLYSKHSTVVNLKVLFRNLFMKLLVGSKSPDSVLKTCKTNDANGFFSYECFDWTEKKEQKRICSIKLPM